MNVEIDNSWFHFIESHLIFIPFITFYIIIVILQASDRYILKTVNFNNRKDALIYLFKTFGWPLSVIWFLLQVALVGIILIFESILFVFWLLGLREKNPFTTKQKYEDEI